MRDIKNVLICGIGAIGSIYANKLSKSGNVNLKILVDEIRLQKYTENPPIFNGEKLCLDYVLPNFDTFKADLIIIATKFDGLRDAVLNIKNFVSPDTIIISLLNGVTSEELIAQKYGWTHVPLAYFIGHSAMRDKNIITHDGVGTIVFGIDSSKNTDIQDINRLTEFFDKTGIDYEIPEDMKRSQWLKYMLNVSSNQPSAIFRMTFGQMQSNKNFMKLLTEIMKEVVKIAKAEGVNNTENMLQDALIKFNKMSADGKTSMLQDVLAHRKTEVEMFAGHIIKLGEKYSIKTPYNRILKNMIDVIEEDFDNV